MPTLNGVPAALTRTVPHLSERALGALLAALAPHLPAPAARGPSGIEMCERIRLVLAKHREGVSWRGLARILARPESTLRSALAPVRAAFEELLPLLPSGEEIYDFEQVIAWCEAHGQALLLDGTELDIQRPKDAAEQGKYYSGKKEYHTAKTIVVSDGAGNLVWLTPLCPGAVHEVKLVREAGLAASLADVNLDVLYDSGGQGLQHEIAALILPEKKKPGGVLSATAKFFNRVHAHDRVVVEHSIGRLKAWRTIDRRKMLARCIDAELFNSWVLTSYQQEWPRGATA